MPLSPQFVCNQGKHSMAKTSSVCFCSDINVRKRLRFYTKNSVSNIPMAAVEISREESLRNSQVFPAYQINTKVASLTTGRSEVKIRAKTQLHK